MMGGEVYVEGCAVPLRGQLPADAFIQLLQKRDKFTRPWLHPETLCLDSRTGQLSGRNGHSTVLWDLVDSHPTHILTGRATQEYLRKRKCQCNAE